MRLLLFFWQILLCPTISALSFSCNYTTRKPSVSIQRTFLHHFPHRIHQGIVQNAVFYPRLRMDKWEDRFSILYKIPDSSGCLLPFQRLSWITRFDKFPIGSAADNQIWIIKFQLPAKNLPIVCRRFLYLFSVWGMSARRFFHIYCTYLFQHPFPAGLIVLLPVFPRPVCFQMKNPFCPSGNIVPGLRSSALF